MILKFTFCFNWGGVDNGKTEKPKKTLAYVGLGCYLNDANNEKKQAANNIKNKRLFLSPWPFRWRRPFWLEIPRSTAIICRFGAYRFTLNGQFSLRSIILPILLPSRPVATEA